MATRHVPVLLDEAIRGLNLHKGGVAVDVTLGGGGHTRAMLEKVLPGGRVIAFDADREAIERFLRLEETDGLIHDSIADGSLSVTHGNFSEVGEALSRENVRTVDAILADFGFSSDQVDNPERGFSFLSDGPLDMRLNRDDSKTAADIVNGYAEDALAQVIRRLGDEPKARKIAKAIVVRRSVRPFRTTADLAECVAECFSEVERRKSRIHVATRTFQAVRMEVNDELGVIERLLRSVPELLNSGGRIGVITFHSGEDALVKELFGEMTKGCVCPPEFPQCVCGKKPAMKIVHPKFVRPTEEEVRINPRSRSAKLRVAEKI